MGIFFSKQLEPGQNRFSNARELHCNATLFFDVLNPMSLNFATRVAFLRYTNSFHLEMNNYERFHCSDMPRANRLIAEELEKHRVREDFWTYKGISKMRLLQMSNHFREASEWTESLESIGPGSILRDQGFVSTSVLAGEAFRKNVLMEILVPKGAYGAGIWRCTSRMGEYEFLLNRNQYFEVNEIKSLGTLIMIECRVIFWGHVICDVPQKGRLY